MAARTCAVRSRRINGVVERGAGSSSESLVFDFDCFCRNQPMGLCRFCCVSSIIYSEALRYPATVWLEVIACGAGGNRTPVHQPLNARDTTIPDTVATQQHRQVDWLMPKH